MQLFIWLFMVDCVYPFTSYARSVEPIVFFFACVAILHYWWYLYYGGESMFVTEDLLAYKLRLNIHIIYIIRQRYKALRKHNKIQ